MKVNEKLLQLVRNAGLAALVCAVALFCGLAIWNLSDDHDSRMLDREITLAERYELISTAKGQLQEGRFVEEQNAISSAQTAPGNIVHERK